MTVKFDARVQRRSIASKVKGIQVFGGAGSFRVGTPEEEKAERAEIRSKYEFYLGALHGLNSSMDTYGTSLVTKAGIERLKGRGKVSATAKAAVVDEWGTFSEQLNGELPTIRFDLKSFQGLLVVSYYPQVDLILSELGSNLDRKHAGLTRAIYGNLGVPVPAEVVAKGPVSLASIKHNLPALAGRAYKSLGIKPVSWKPIDGETPEEAADGVGDVFVSTVSKFEVRKPDANWVFDTATMNPTMRLRMRYVNKDLKKKLVSGVELRDYPLAENNKDLARLDENWTRGHWPAFELIESKRLEVGDRSMPNGKRLGQEMRYTFKAGSMTFQVIQYSLFCRWHKRTYTVMSFASSDVYADWEKTFEKINSSFKVLDAPKLQERLKKEDKRKKDKEDADKRKKDGK